MLVILMALIAATVLVLGTVFVVKAIRAIREYFADPENIEKYY